MTWIILIQLLVLVFLSFNHKKLESASNLRPAWGWFSGVFLSQAAMTFFRAGIMMMSEELMLVEIWTNGFVWFFIGMSILFLPSLFLGKPTSSEFFDDNDVKTASYNKPPALPQSVGATSSSSEGGGSVEIEEKPKE